jgi:molybdopterin converting factor small subunit
MIRALFFGPVAERVQMRETQLEFTAGMRLQDVVATLSARHPRAFDIVSFTAVNQAQVKDMQMKLNDGDEIAFMAKFSGG